MEIFNIGPLELLFIFLLVLIIFGQKDLEKAGKTIGRGLNKMVTSDTWKALTQVSRKIRYLPNELMREAKMEETDPTKVAADAKDPYAAWASGTGAVIGTPDRPPERVNTIAPPVEEELSK